MPDDCDFLAKVLWLYTCVVYGL